MDLNAVAIELQLVNPIVARGGLASLLCELGLNETGHGFARRLAQKALDLLSLTGVGVGRRGGRPRFAFRIADQKPLPGIPNVVSALGNLLHGSLSDRAIRSLLNDRRRFLGLSPLVSLLDQEPVGFVGAIAVILDAHQRPLAPQLGAVQLNLQVPLFELTFDIAESFPLSEIPDHHGPAAILA